MPVPQAAPHSFHAYVSANAAAQAVGKFGAQFLAGVGAAWTGTGAAATPFASSIYCLNDTVFSTLTAADTKKVPFSTTGTVTAVTAITFPAGTQIFGLWSAVTLTSGAVMIYYA